MKQESENPPVSQKKRILQLVKNYMYDSAPDYALMLDGPWGSGKTYFVNNLLKEHVESLPVLRNEEEGDKFSFLYVSLNGVSSISEIEKRVVFGSVGKFGDLMPKVFSVLDGLGKIAGVMPVINKLIAKDIESNLSLSAEKLIKGFSDLSNGLMVFDDLERISPSIHVEDVLGFINTHFVEHNETRVMIVADESRLLKREIEDETREITAKYSEQKEKIIRWTIRFEMDLLECLDSLIGASGDSKFVTILERNRMIIRHMISFLEINNLRTIKFTFSILERLMKYLPDDIGNEVLHPLIYFCLLVSREYKIGFPDDGIDYRDVLLSENSFMDRLVLGAMQIRNEREEKVEVPEKEKRKREIQDRFIFQNAYPYHAYGSIFDFICSGNLDVGRFKEEIEGRLPKELSSTELLIKSIRQFRMLSDEDFRKKASELLSCVKEGKVHVTEYYRLFAYFHLFITKGLIEQEEGHLKKNFMAGFEIAKAARGDDTPALDIEHYSVSDGMPPFSNELCDRLRQLIRDEDIASERELAVRLWDNFFENINESMSDDNIGLNKMDVFQFIEPEFIFQKLKDSPYEKVANFNEYIERRYLRTYKDRDRYRDDLTFMQELLHDIQKYIKSLPGRDTKNTIERFNVQELESSIQKVVELMTKAM